MPQRRDNFLGLFLSNLAPGLNQIAQQGLQQQMFDQRRQAIQEGQLEQLLVRSGLDPSLASDPMAAADAIRQMQEQQAVAGQQAATQKQQMGQFDDFLGADPLEQTQRASAMQAFDNPMAGLALAQVRELPFQQDNQTGEISRPQVSETRGVPVQEIRQTAKQPIPPLPGREEFLRERNIQNIEAESQAARQTPAEAAARERAVLGVRQEFEEEETPKTIIDFVQDLNSFIDQGIKTAQVPVDDLQRLAGMSTEEQVQVLLGQGPRITQASPEQLQEALNIASQRTAARLLTITDEEQFRMASRAVPAAMRPAVQEQLRILRGQ